MRCLSLVPLFALVLTTATAAEDSQVIFQSGTGGYHTCRIPGLVLTKQGTLLAFCEGRKSSRSDAGDIDLLLKRSTDGGKTWSAQQLVYEDGGDAPVTIGNPCPVVDQQTGTIWLPFCRDNDRVFMTHSVDDGVSWTAPVEMTSTVKQDDWGWYATGPGHGIQIQRGPHAGRLVIPCDYRLKDKPRVGEYRHSHVIFSDDHGKSWQLGGSTGSFMNECEVVERADGSLLLCMRNYLGKNRRAFAVSADGGANWAPPELHDDVFCPTCQASIHRFSLEPNVVLYTGPGGPGRSNLTIRLSRDDGASWPVSRVLFNGPAAYSELAVLANGDIVCLFEGGERDAYETIRLTRFRLDWLENQ
ncbi:exo-alpha-sialidase [bacterium]|nr:exo-alpha-sialidase [bacterium]